MATTTELQLQVDPVVWKACAGASVHIPTVESRVYYFPQGHAEQSYSLPPSLLSPLVSSHPFILCRVAAVSLLANPDTDEVFAKIRLVPIYHSLHSDELDKKRGRSIEGGGEEAAMASFAKILTPSDANNGGGFSVPRFCADSIFPPLDFTADPPVQNILIRDVRGVDWEFRHIYRGTPRRHLLTTGWSKFVNHKKLVAGDSVVFMRKRNSGELFVGLRRAVRSNPDSGGRWNCPVGPGRGKSEEEGEGGGKEGFWRRGKGRVSAESVAAAADFAAQGLEFEVIYYPKVWCADFVVKAETVESSLSVCWSPGTRVKMAMETEDSSRMTWFQGTVSSSLFPDNDPWRGSPWRMLQVTWDEHELLQNMKRVSPWQVEYVVPTPLPHSPLPPAKKFRVPQNPGFATNGDGDTFLAGLGSSMAPFMNHKYFPAGMQGARHVPFSVSVLPNFQGENSHHTMIPQLKMVSTELTIGSSLCDNLSPDSQSSVHFFGSVVGKKAVNSPEKVGLGSIQLFGKTIYTKDAVESGYDELLCTEVNGSPMSKEGRGMEKTGFYIDFPVQKTSWWT